MVVNSGDDSVLEGKRNELLVLMDKIHQQTSPRWYDININDDANSLYRLIGIQSLEHFHLILKAAGFMPYNSRSKSYTFRGQLFLDAIAKKYPLLTIAIKVEKMGGKRNWWVLLGALGKAQSGPEQLADDKRMKAENRTRPPQYLSKYLEQAIAEFVESNPADSSPEQGQESTSSFRTITPTTPASMCSQVAQVSSDRSIESQKGFEKDDHDDIQSTSKASEINSNESTRDDDNIDWKAKAQALGRDLFQATNYLHSFVQHCDDKMTNIEEVKDFLSQTAPRVVTPSNVLDMKQPPKLSTWFGTKTVEVAKSD
jgi:hypothetical protein